jgi:hypothetical protein
VHLAVDLVPDADAEPVERVEHVELGHGEIATARSRASRSARPARRTSRSGADGRSSRRTRCRACAPRSAAAPRARWAAARCRRASCTPSPRRAPGRSRSGRCRRHRAPPAVVLLDVTYGYVPWSMSSSEPCAPSSSTAAPACTARCT